MHGFAGYWVAEPYLGSVEHQTLALGAIELVAHDGTAQSVGVGAVDAQLVGAAGLGIEGDYGGWLMADGGWLMADGWDDSRNS